MSYPPDYYADGSCYPLQPQGPNPRSTTADPMYYNGGPEYAYGPSSGQDGAGSVPAAYGGEAGAMGYGYGISMNTTSTQDTSHRPHSQHFSTFNASSNPGHSRQRHEYRLIEGTLSDEDADGYLQRRGRNIYECHWPGCQVHLSIKACTPACNQCHQRLHISKEGGRIHIRKEHYGRPELYECTVCPRKTFQRKADAKKHCDAMNGKNQ